MKRGREGGLRDRERERERGRERGGEGGVRVFTYTHHCTTL